MPLRYYANAPATTLAASCSAAATSITVASTSGLPIQYPYTLIIDKGTISEEAVSVTAAAGTTLTVTRGYDSTAAFSHVLGASVEHGIVAADIREANSHVNASSAVHGVTGSLVGTSDTQTLTSKTISADNNTINGFAASSFVVTDGTGKADGSAAQKAIPSGAVVGTTDTQTLSNKTLTAPSATGSLSGFGGAWTAYTPGAVNWNYGSGAVFTGAYTRVGRTVTFRARVVLGTGFVISGAPGLTLPFESVVSSVAAGPIWASWTDAGSNVYQANPLLYNAGGSYAYVLVFSINGFLAYQVPTSTSPFTWAAGDVIECGGTYEAIA